MKQSNIYDKYDLEISKPANVTVNYIERKKQIGRFKSQQNIPDMSCGMIHGHNDEVKQCKSNVFKPCELLN